MCNGHPTLILTSKRAHIRSGHHGRSRVLKHRQGPTGWGACSHEAARWTTLLWLWAWYSDQSVVSSEAFCAAIKAFCSNDSRSGCGTGAVISDQSTVRVVLAALQQRARIVFFGVAVLSDDLEGIQALVQSYVRLT